MAGFSDAYELKLLDKVFGATDFSPPGTTYISLHTADPGETGANEVPNSGSYARASYTNNTTNWPNASSGQKKNANTISFAQATGSWGTVTHFGIWDNGTYGAGVFLGGGALSASRAPVSGDILQFLANQLVINLD